MSLKEISEEVYLRRVELFDIVNKFYSCKKKTLCYPLFSSQDYKKLKGMYSKRPISDETYKKLMELDLKEIRELSDFLSVGVSYLLFDIEAGEREFKEQGEGLKELTRDFEGLAKENEKLISIIERKRFKN